MRVVTLSLAFVASLSSARVGAMDHDRRAHRDRHGLIERRSTFSPTHHLDMTAWADHDHNHGIRIQYPIAGNSNRSQKQILLTRVENGTLAQWHVLIGELVPNPNITTCNGPFGYAVVDLDDSEILYACLHPPRNENSSENSEHFRGAPEFYVYVVRNRMSPRSLIGVLTTGDARITLTSFLERRASQDMQRLGHVRYMKYDLINPINADGDVYTHVNQ